MVQLLLTTYLDDRVFALIVLLVVVLIYTILARLLVSVVLKVCEAAARSTCQTTSSRWVLHAFLRMRVFPAWGHTREFAAGSCQGLTSCSLL
jgi:hypothetical protein